MPLVTRFAPSPTGELHLGSAYSAWTGWHRAREAGGTFLVRIEDIDIRRCKRDRDMTIRALRESGMTAEEVMEKALRIAGLEARS